ncbi:MAG: Crp/Fnr family transcriptional regulator [Sphingobacteriales bacterium]|nr:Crp/Fnr family transcriptional regulator [Sphingobacteriales bacterium]MBI3717666.1 Crp/Fnr family transcriptional regulator [Sphingobacteriales bacterium]
MKQNKKNCDLHSCVLCKQCQSDWLPAIDAARKSFHFKKGELLFTEGKEVTGMFFVTNGLVKVHKKWGSDKELILRIAKDGDIVGHRGLGSDTIYPVSGTALEPTDVCFVSLDFFNSTLKVNPDFLFQLMMFFAAELKESEKKMRNLAHMTVKGRTANALLALQQKFGTNPDGSLGITLSRQDFASYIGTTYETSFRTMNELADEKIIKMEGKNFFLLNEEKLIAYTGDGN